MAKRKKRPRRRRRLHDAPGLRLPFPPPFDEERLRDMRMRDFIEDDQCREYLMACENAIHQSARASRYVTLLEMFAHMGRLDEFDESSVHKFMAEARNQPISDARLLLATDHLLLAVGEGKGWSSSAEIFEVLSFTAGLLRRYAETHSKNTELIERADALQAGALGYFIVAVKREFQLMRRDS